MTKILVLAALGLVFAAGGAVAAPRLVANLSLGTPVRIAERQFTIPVIVATDSDSMNAQAFCFRLKASTPLVAASVQHSGFTEGQPAVFEWQSSTAASTSYVVVYNERIVQFPAGLPVTFAEVTITLPDDVTSPVRLDFDPSSVTMVSTEDGMLSATIAKGTLATMGVTIDLDQPVKRRSSGR